ncbi:MAG: hypothetical protein DYG94_00655 [Leptolyngbya sp. PLA3]|nr:MAG: hypothetical protein EDM82_01220 [Cyanobacteria bacterium CYA]MCE7967244.1 hypothetical protein [Leptolyngbya sp. PL-A3]
MSRGAPSDPAALPTFAPFQAVDSGRTIDQVFAACNANMFEGYGLHLLADAARPLAFPLCAYRQLIASIASMPHIEPVTLRQLCRQPDGRTRVRLAIRHDVDGDVVAAERSAEIEAEFHVPTSYYFLHTAFYNGSFDGQTFRRHACMAHIYRRIQSLGHEVGLHTNGLEVYQRFGIDGAAAVAEEIAWMRAAGLDVRGTVGHGSKPVFGAENFEIFTGRRKGRARDDTLAQQKEPLEHQARHAMLHVLDERELELEYEGNDIFWQKKIRVEYGATRSVDGWRWNRRFDRDHPLPFCSQERMLADIAQLEPGCCVVLTIHPCYYGLRHRRDTAPVQRLERRPVVVHPDLGWRTWEPGRVVAVHEAHDDPRLERQTLHVPNQLGMLDVHDPLSPARLEAPRRVLILDGGAMADPGIAMPSSAPRLLESLLNSGGNRTACLSLTHPGMGASRLYGWLLFALSRFKPTDVILGLTAIEPARSLPAIWSMHEGLSWHHPAGACLAPDAQSSAEHRDASPGWRVRQQLPRLIENWPGISTPLSDIAAAPKLPRVDGVDAEAFLSTCLARIAATCASIGAGLHFVLTDDVRPVRDPAFREHFRAAAARWCKRLGPIVDPFDSYDALDAEGIDPLRPAGGLSIDAHRALAEALAAALLPAQ